MIIMNKISGEEGIADKTKLVDLWCIQSPTFNRPLVFFFFFFYEILNLLIIIGKNLQRMIS